jgi:hypothetical protein
MIDKKMLIPLFMEDVAFDGNVFDVIKKIESLGYFVRTNTVFYKQQDKILKKYYCAILKENPDNNSIYIIEYYSDKSLKHCIKKSIRKFIKYHFQEENSTITTMSFSMNRAFNLNKPNNEIYS